MDPCRGFSIIITHVWGATVREAVPAAAGDYPLRMGGTGQNVSADAGGRKGGTAGQKRSDHTTKSWTTSWDNTSGENENENENENDPEHLLLESPMSHIKRDEETPKPPVVPVVPVVALLLPAGRAPVIRARGCDQESGCGGPPPRAGPPVVGPARATPPPNPRPQK